MASSLLTSSKQQVKRLGYKITLKAHPLFWNVPFLLYCIISHSSHRSVIALVLFVCIYPRIVSEIIHVNFSVF